MKGTVEKGKENSSKGLFLEVDTKQVVLGWKNFYRSVNEYQVEKDKKVDGEPKFERVHDASSILINRALINAVSIAILHSYV